MSNSEIEGHLIVIHELRKALDAAHRKHDVYDQRVSKILKENINLKKNIALMTGAVVTNGEAQRLFEERNRRSWR